MKIQAALALLVSVLALPNAGRSEGTNETADLFGITVTQKTSEAEKQFGTGYAYLTGDGVEQDLAKAIECFRKAAELGHAQAQFNLAICCMQGNGVEQSDQEAAKWFGLAAEQDISEAIYPLGICLYNLEQYPEAYAQALRAEAAGDPRLKEMLTPMFSEEEMAKGKTLYADLVKQAEARKAAKKKKAVEAGKTASGGQ